MLRLRSVSEGLCGTEQPIVIEPVEVGWGETSGEAG